MKPKKIHFISRGNTYRSRLAEALFRAFELKGYHISSSGIAASEQSVSLEWAAERLLKTHGLARQAARTRTQTTKQLLKDADVLIFMSKDVFDEAQKHFTVDARKAQIWHIADLRQLAHRHNVAHEDREAMAKLAERDFSQLQIQVTKLKTYLTQGSWHDVVDEYNKPVGLRLPTAWVSDRGLWHRGCHAIITTPDKRYIVEKRSEKIILAPGHLEVTMGGGVDTGEKSRQAVVREIHEELGLHIRPEQAQLIDVCKWASYHPHYKKVTKVFLYTYHVPLNTNEPVFTPQVSEVARVELIGQRRLNRLLRTHRLRHLGELNYGYQYYRRVLKLARPLVGQRASKSATL